MKSKIFILMFCIILLVGSVSSFEFDNSLRYEDNDLKVTIENIWGLPLFGSDLGTIELKSHKDINYKKDVCVGSLKDEVTPCQVSMYYDFSDWEEYLDGLGDVKFKDKYGNLVERDWRYVYLTNETYEEQVYECDKFPIPTESSCRENGTINKTREVWKIYNSKDIPKDKITLGIEVEVKVNDNVDGIWNIAGKKIDKHAIWLASDVVFIENQEDLSGASSYNFTSVSFGTEDDTRILIIGAGGRQGADPVSVNTITINGISSTKIGQAQMANNAVAAMFNISGISGTSGFVTVSFSGTMSGAGLGVWAIYNSNGTMKDFDTDAGTSSLQLNLSVEESGSIVGYSYGTSTNPSVIWSGLTEDFEGVVDTRQSGASDDFGTTIDDYLINVTMTSSSGSGGIASSWYGTLLDLLINSISPLNNTQFTTNDISLVGNVTPFDPGRSITNVSILVDGIINQTNTSGIEGIYNFSISDLSDGTHNWTIQAFDNESTISNSRNGTLFFNVDINAPTINIISPTGQIDFHEVNTNLSVNWTVSDANLDTCILEYEGINRTVTCNDNQTQINITNSINKTIIFYANDTFGNQNSSSRTWDYRIFWENKTFNTSSYETKSETFTINITANSSLTAVTLDYNGTDYSTTKSGTVYSTTLNVPTGLLNKTFKWKFTYAGDTINSPETNQNISLTNFSICDGSLTDDFLNISFKDEDDLSVLNASIPSSTFIYYLGSGTVNKTFNYINNNLNYNYTFCATPNQTLNVDSIVQYKQGTDYPQRIFDPEVTQYTSTVTNKTLYLLNSLDGIFVTFQVINSLEQGISGTDVTGVREISGEDVTIASGTTDSSGSITFWLNPDFLHKFTFVKTGFETASTSIFPNQASYTITLTGGDVGGAIDYTQGISRSFKPIGFVLNDSLVNFNYTISSNFWVLEEFGFTLSYSNGTVIGTQTSTSNTGGTIGLDATTGSNGTMIMNHYYLINSTYTNGTVIWSIYKSNAFSIQHLLERVVTYIDADLMGVQSDDEGYFFKATMSVFILIALSGVLSTRYGIASEQAISGIIFGVLLLLNTLNLIPTPSGTTFTNLGDFLVGLVGFILLMSIFKEESR